MTRRESASTCLRFAFYELSDLYELYDLTLELDVI